MTKVYDRVSEMLTHIMVNNPNRDEVVLMLSYEDHRAHEAEMKKDGLPVVALDEVLARSGIDIVTLYNGPPTLAIKKSGLLWMAERTLRETVKDAKRSLASPGDVRDPTQAALVAFNDIVMARGNRIGPRGDILVG